LLVHFFLLFKEKKDFFLSLQHLLTLALFLLLLKVVNLGSNEIMRIQGLAEATELKALVLNNNKLTMIENLETNTELNTLGTHLLPYSVC
jgi:hypothetical protein